ncbi:MAG: hypothetical protein Q9169_001477 [Polycauliona sp. 2 TL-2023]
MNELGSIGTSAMIGAMTTKPTPLHNGANGHRDATRIHRFSNGAGREPSIDRNRWIGLCGLLCTPIVFDRLDRRASFLLGSSHVETETANCSPPLPLTKRLPSLDFPNPRCLVDVDVDGRPPFLQ